MNVYNLSDMTRAEAEALVTKAEGRLCIRYYQRKDGTVLTRDCPTGVRIRRRRRRGLMAGLAASLSMVAGGVFGAWTRPIASAQPKPVVWDEPLMGAVEHRPAEERHLRLEKAPGVVVLVRQVDRGEVREPADLDERPLGPVQRLVHPQPIRVLDRRIHGPLDRLLELPPPRLAQGRGRRGEDDGGREGRGQETPWWSEPRERWHGRIPHGSDGWPLERVELYRAYCD